MNKKEIKEKREELENICFEKIFEEKMIFINHSFFYKYFRKW